MIITTISLRDEMVGTTRINLRSIYNRSSTSTDVIRLIPAAAKLTIQPNVNPISRTLNNDGLDNLGNDIYSVIQSPENFATMYESLMTRLSVQTNLYGRAAAYLKVLETQRFNQWKKTRVTNNCLQMPRLAIGASEQTTKSTVMIQTIVL